MEKKQKLGQFFTTNYKYILNNLEIPETVKEIVEPFCGNGDLIKDLDKKKYNIDCYDIDPKLDFIKKRDTLKNPPKYKNKFIITNPPYLARNKSDDKELFDKYDVNDLYKCFLKNLLLNKCNGGIIIVPLNFLSSIRLCDIKLRMNFLDVYRIVRVNIFEEQVFDDTTYTVCAFLFVRKDKKDKEIEIVIYPSKKVIKTVLNDKNNYIIGGEIYKIKRSEKYKITRLTSKNSKNTNILVKCIDDNKSKKINLCLVNDSEIYIDTTPNLSSRTYATLVIEPEIDNKKQKKLVKEFNIYLNKNREKYNSLFLTNYRESKDIARKRISFDLVYLICGNILDKMK